MIKITIEEGIATLALACPEHKKALSAAMRAALSEALVPQ